jgi:hypothetical protein
VTAAGVAVIDFDVEKDEGDFVLFVKHGTVHIKGNVP